MSDLLATFCAIFSSENAQKGLSKLGGKEGSVIASPIVTLVDDPFYPGSPLQRPFDAEGSPTCRKNVIEKGEFKTLLYNLKTAALAGKQTTGNASKAGYDGLRMAWSVVFFTRAWESILSRFPTLTVNSLATSLPSVTTLTATRAERVVS